MQIRPDNFSVSAAEIRKRFHLTQHDTVFDYGFETKSDPYQKHCLTQLYDSTSLFIRTVPDFLIHKGGRAYLVEAKQRTTFLEAAQLFYNKELADLGVWVIYSFPDFYIPAEYIPIETIYVPEKYRRPFLDYFSGVILEKHPKVIFEMVPDNKGSGDPYIKIDEETLREFSETSRI